MCGRFQYLLISSNNSPRPTGMYRSLSQKALEESHLKRKKTNPTLHTYKRRNFKWSDYTESLYRNYTEIARLGDDSHAQQQYGNASIL